LVEINRLRDDEKWSEQKPYKWKRSPHITWNKTTLGPAPKTRKQKNAALWLRDKAQ